jgi:hypothetical protein
MTHHADGGASDERSALPIALGAASRWSTAAETEHVSSRPEPQPRPARPVRHACWRNAGVLVGALLFALLSACSDSSGSAHFGAPSGAGSAGASGSSGTSGSAGMSGSAGTSGSSGASGVAGAARFAGSAISAASCSGTSCSVVLAGTGSQVHVLDTTISLQGIQDGRAALRVGDHDVSCTRGQRVSSDSLRLECRTVTDSSVEFTVSIA